MAALLVAETPGWLGAMGVLAGIGWAGILLALIFRAVRQPVPIVGVVSLSLVFGLSLLCLPGLISLYYVSFLVRILPVPRAALAPLAAAGLALCALAAAWLWRPGRCQPAPDWAPVRLGAFLLLVPLSLWVGEVTARPPARPSGGAVRVMTYNIHAAFGLNGSLDVEAVAQVIADSGAGAVALQEISRGWLINGNADLLALLARRLSMPAAVIGPAADPVAGNALLSQYPIRASGHGDLPQLDSLVGRGYVWAQLDWGAGEPLLVMNTHLATESVELRLAQLTALLKAWAGRPRTVLAGDMNALSGSREIEMILEAGFVDAWSEAGQLERPRIDWIFHTPDLVARDVAVIESPASDHPAYAATINPNP
jgi:endonuclease/exonuclease/phosphatase family metal-dependent hydrolase